MHSLWQHYHHGTLSLDRMGQEGKVDLNAHPRDTHDAGLPLNQRAMMQKVASREREREDQRMGRDECRDGR